MPNTSQDQNPWDKIVSPSSSSNHYDQICTCTRECSSKVSVYKWGTQPFYLYRLSVISKGLRAYNSNGLRAYKSNTMGWHSKPPFIKTRWFYYLHLANPQWGFSRTYNIHDDIGRIVLAGYNTLTLESQELQVRVIGKPLIRDDRQRV